MSKVCSCGKGDTTPLTEHALDCVLRLKKDSLRLAINCDEKELLQLNYLFERMQTVDGATYQAQQLSGLHERFREALTTVATVRATGKFPTGSIVTPQEG